MRSLRTTPVVALSGAVLLAAGCSDPSAPPMTWTTSPTAPHAAVIDAGQPVVALSDFSVVGSSKLVRTAAGVSYNLTTTGLTPGHAYTLWIVIFNETAGCAAVSPTFCGPDDVVNDDARPDMMYAAGHVVGASGKATFAGHRKAGDASGSVNAPVGMPAYALYNPLGAEIHFVVHDHGPMLPAFLPDMTQTIAGGCSDAGVPAAGVPSPWNDYTGLELGRRGPNTCVSVQAVAHQP